VARWTLGELVAEVGKALESLPPPKNGQIRAVPDERTIRYYATLGLLDRPLEMRGRTALYGRRHVAQVAAIKRMQAAGRSLSEIQALWPSLDDATLARLTGIAVDPAPRAGGGELKAKAARLEFWKRTPMPSTPSPAQAPTPQPVELRIELAANLSLVVAIAADRHLSLQPSDLRALRWAAAPLVAELAQRGLIEEDP
jgi:DNA-binding transcriptional MerR regulator